MPSPSTSLATLRPDLSGSLEQYDLAMDREGFIAHRVLPAIEVQSQAGKFGKIPLAQLLRTRDTNRASRAGYARGDWTFTTDSYACEEHGAEEPVDERDAAIYGEYFDAEQVSAQLALDVVLRNAEIRAAAAIFNAVTWTPTEITHEWDDYTNAVPITDVETAVQAHWAESGIWPNALIINRKVFRNARLCDSIIDKLKYQGFQDVRPDAIGPAELARLFDLDEVIVAGSAKNTAKEGQSASLSSIWSDEYAMVCRVARTGSIKEPCLGRTFHWSEDGSTIGGTTEAYRDETVRADIVRCRHDVDEKILYTAMGQLLSNVTTI